MRRTTSLRFRTTTPTSRLDLPAGSAYNSAMISRLQILNYRCLRYVDQALDSFHVLVGPNASGKTTLLDSVSFLVDIVNDGLEEAVSRRTGNFHDLVWKHRGGRFELAVDVRLPVDKLQALERSGFDSVRYELAVEMGEKGELVIPAERAMLLSSAASLEGSERTRDTFPFPGVPPPHRPLPPPP